MKKLLKFGTMLAVLFSAMTGYAGEKDFALFVKKIDVKTVRVTFNGIQKMELSIYDDGNALIHEENVSGKAGIKRTYSLENLPDGIYFLEAKTDNKVARYKMTIGRNSVAIVSKPVSESYTTVQTIASR